MGSIVDLLDTISPSWGGGLSPVASAHRVYDLVSVALSQDALPSVVSTVTSVAGLVERLSACTVRYDTAPTPASASGREADSGCLHQALLAAALRAISASAPPLKGVCASVSQDINSNNSQELPRALGRLLIALTDLLEQPAACFGPASPLISALATAASSAVLSGLGCFVEDAPVVYVAEARGPAQ